MFLISWRKRGLKMIPIEAQFLIGIISSFILLIILLIKLFEGKKENEKEVLRWD